MSPTYKFWVATTEQINDLRLQNEAFEKLRPKITDFKQAHMIYGELFLKYLRIFKSLAYLYDKTMQVQKRSLIFDLLDVSCKRVFELRNDLKNIEMSEFVYFDDLIVAKKIYPETLDLMRPAFFPIYREASTEKLLDPLERTLKKLERIKYLNKLERVKKNSQGNEKGSAACTFPETTGSAKRSKANLLELENVEDEVFQGADATTCPLSEVISPFRFNGSDYSILCLPRESSVDMIEESNNDEKSEISSRTSEKESIQEIPHLHCNLRTMPKLVTPKGGSSFTKKHLTARINEQEMKLQEQQCATILNLQKQEEHNLFEENFKKVVENHKNRIVRIYSSWIMEDISDQVRYWLQTMYKVTGKFPRYPEDWESGTILLLLDKLQTAEDVLKNSNAKTSKNQKPKEKKKPEKKGGKKKKTKVKVEMSDYYENEVMNPNFVRIKEIMDKYELNWMNIDEEKNMAEKPYMDFIAEDNFADLHQELRPIVDEMMRIELELLRKALAKDMGKKYKPSKKKKQKGKKGKKKKERIVYDMTADCSTKNLYEILYGVGIIQPLERNTKRLNCYIGEYNFRTPDDRFRIVRDVPPTKKDVTNLLREYMIGLGPIKTSQSKSICLIGPPSSGKNFLVKSMAMEIGAVVFKLEPSIVKMFEAKMDYLIHLIVKMAKILEPTIIYLNNVHRMFWKKVPKENQLESPRLLSKYLFKGIVKPLRTNQVLVVGTSDAPWQAKLKPMKKCFQKFIMVPKNDYGTSYLLWQSAVSSLFSKTNDIEASPLAWVAKFWETGQVLNLIKKLMCRSDTELQIADLDHKEILDFLLKNEVLPLTEKEFKKYEQFYKKVDRLEKVRRKAQKAGKKKK